MVAFVVGRPVASDSPRISVDAGLRPGVHRFQLVVVDSAGQRSAPDEVRVQVGDPLQPVLPVDPIDLPVRPPVRPPTPIPRSRRRP